jgi:Protein of unknown function (DUF3667)
MKSQVKFAAPVIPRIVVTFDPWECPTCNKKVSTPFCAWCGEQPLSARHLTLRDLALQTASQFSSVDSKLLRSLRWLVLRPGVLSIAYIQGRRKGFVGPIQLFLIANLIFIAMQSLTQTNIFSSPLQSHLFHQDWSAFARSLVLERLAKSHQTLSEYMPLFDQAAVLHAKSMIILMVVAFAIFLPITFHDSRRPFAAHIVFSLHLYSFLLLLFCVSLAIAFVDRALGGTGLASGLLDKSVSLFHLVGCAVYLHLAMGRVYRTRGAMRIAKAITLSVIISVLVLSYRFAIFLITLYST